MSLTPGPMKGMHFNEVAEELLALGGRATRSPIDKLAICEMVLQALANMPGESIWMDDRDDAANLMVGLARMALKKI